MTTERIKEIQDKTAFPDSVSVQQALLQVWNECQEENYHKKYTEEDIRKAIEYGYELRNNNKPINGGIDWVKEFNSLNKQD